MSKARKLVGLGVIGNAVHSAVEKAGELTVVAKSVEALGVPLNMFCTGDYPSVPNQPGDGKLIDVVIGDPYLLRKVKVVAKWSKDSPEVPDDVRLALYPYDEKDAVDDDGVNEIIVFETEDGSLVYAEAYYTTLLENVKDLINKGILENV